MSALKRILIQLCHETEMRRQNSRSSHLTLLSPHHFSSPHNLITSNSSHLTTLSPHNLITKQFHHLTTPSLHEPVTSQPHPLQYSHLTIFSSHKIILSHPRHLTISSLHNPVTSQTLHFTTPLL